MLKTDLTTYLTERASSSFASNSPAWGCGLQDEFPDIHGERGLPRKRGFMPPLWAPVSIITACPCAQVAGEVLEELCGQMGVLDSGEVQEFALFLIKGEGEPRDSLPCPSRCLRHTDADSVLFVLSADMGLIQVSWFGRCRPMSTSTM